MGELVCSFKYFELTSVERHGVICMRLCEIHNLSKPCGLQAAVAGPILIHRDLGDAAGRFPDVTVS